MAKRDVELVIKAKDDASRALGKISDALNVLETDQNDLAKSADGAGKKLGQLGAAVKKLEAQSQVGSALGVVTASIDKTNAALTHQRSELNKTETEMVDYAAKLILAKEALEAIQTSSIVGPRTRAETKQYVNDIKLAESAISKLQTGFDNSVASAEHQRTAIEKTEVALLDLEKASLRSMAAMNQEGEAADKLVQRLARVKAEATAQRTFQTAGPQTATPTLNAGNAQAQARAAKEEYRSAITTLSELQAALRATKTPTVELGQELGLQRAKVVELEASYRTLAAAASDQISRDRAHGQALAENAKRLRDSKAALEQIASAERAHAEALAIDARRAKEAAQALTLLHAEALKLNKAFDLKRAESGFTGLIAKIRQLNGESRQSLGIFERMRGQILAVGASYVGVFGAANLVQGLFEAQRAMDGILAKFTVGFGGDKNKAAQELEFVRKVANDLGLDLRTLATDYSQLTVATQGTILEGQRTRDIFMSVAKASRVLNLSAEDTSGIIKALTQIVSKGTVMSEELRGQIGDRLPGALQLMANGTKVTTAQLLKLMEQGKLSSEALVNFAFALSQKVAPGVDDASKRASASVERLKTAWFELQLRLANSGLMDAMGHSLDEIAKVLRDPQTIEAITTFGKALGELVVNAINFIKNNPDAIVNSLKAIGAILALKIVGGMVSSLIALTETIILLMPKLKAMGVAFAAMSGPVGWVTLAAAALAYFVLTAKDILTPAELVTKHVQEMTKAYRELTDAQKGNQRVKWADQLEETNKQIAETQAAIDQLAKSNELFAKAPGAFPSGKTRGTSVNLQKLQLQMESLRLKSDELRKSLQETMKTDLEEFNKGSNKPENQVEPPVAPFIDSGKIDKIAERIRKQNEEFQTRLAMLLAKDAENNVDETLLQQSIAIDTKYAPAYALLVKGGKDRNSEEHKVLDQLVEQEKLIATQKTQARELAREVKARNDAEKQVNDLVSLRELIQNRILFLQKQGAPTGEIDALKQQMIDLDVILKQNIASAIALYQPLADLGNIDAQTTITKLQVINDTLGQIKESSKLSAEQINRDFAGSAAQSLVSFGEAIGKVVQKGGGLKGIFSAAKDAFRQFAADFLKHIATMILEQAIFNALQSSSNSSIGGIIGSAVGSAAKQHSGGIAGVAGNRVSVAPAWFNNAPKYHTGGIAGLKADEVPAILQKGEEVLTRNDPRHRMNSTPAEPQSIKIINTIDSASVINEGLSTAAGQKAFINAIKTNKSSIKSVLM